MRELDKGVMFSKDNIVGDTKTMRDRIITTTPLLSFAIAKKRTKARTRCRHRILNPLRLGHSFPNNTNSMVQGQFRAQSNIKLT